jgi:hypothetical protein
MESPERHAVLVSGEIARADWELSLRLLGKLGLQAVPVDTRTGAELLPTDQLESLIAPDLRSIRHVEQFVGLDHFQEYWPKYRKSRPAQGRNLKSKHDATDALIHTLSKPMTHGRYYHTPVSLREWRERVGLEMRTRPPLEHGNREWPYVFTVGSLLKFSEGYESVDVIDRICDFKASQRRYLSSFLASISGQLRSNEQGGA